MMLRRFFCLVTLVTVVAAMAQTPLAHPWEGKTVAYFGDSISDPNHKAAPTKYWSLLEQWLGITPYVYARSGRQWDDIPRQTAQLKAEHGDSVDAILIMMGTNDYNKGVPVGVWYDEQVEPVEAAIGEPKRTFDRMHRHMSMDPATYRGRINIALDSLKRTYPTKQIVLLTPIHRGGFYHSPTNWQPTEEYANRSGIFLDEYVQAVIEAGRVWAVPVIDLNALCGLFPMADEHAQYFCNPDNDRLHPNDKGHQRMARTLYYQLLTLPCSF